MMRATLGRAAVLLIIAAAANGCGASTDSTKPSANSPSAPSVSATPQTADGRAGAAGEAAVRQYWATRAVVDHTPRATLDRLRSVAAGTALIAAENDARQLRKNGWHLTGTAKMTKIRVNSVDLTHGEPTVIVTACFDSRGTDIVDRRGQSKLSSSRPTLFTQKFTVIKYSKKKGQPSGWLVAVVEDQAVGSCTL